MDKQEHRVFRVNIDYSMPDTEEANPVQNRMSHLMNTRLTQQLDDLFTEFSHPNFPIQLDRLEIDLGSISLDDFETELPLRLEEVLRKKLQAIIQKQGVLEPSGIKKLIPRLEVLAFFLSKGGYPWWAKNKFTENPVELFRPLLESHQGALKNMLLNTMGSEWVRKRMVHSFEWIDLKAVVRLLEPVESETIINYQEELAIQQEKTAFIKAERRDFQKLSWEVILKYLYEERGSEFNQKSFLKQVLIDLANRFNTTYQELIQKLEIIAAQFDATNQKRASFLKNILLLAKEETNHTEVESKEKFSSLPPEVLEGLSKKERQLVLAYLPLIEKDYSHWPEKISDLDTRLLLLERLWLSQPTRAIGWVKRLAFRGQAGINLLNRLPAPMIQATLADLHPNLHQEFWHLQEDLIALARLRLLGSLTPHAIEQIIRKYYFQLLSQVQGRSYNVPTLLQPLIEQIAAQNSQSYPVFLQTLQTLLSQANSQVHLRSKLLAYWRVLLREEGRPNFKARSETQDWGFDPKKESISVYLERIKSWLPLKEKRFSLGTIWAKPNMFSKWLPNLLTTWTGTDKQQLFQLLWPSSYDFAAKWIKDSTFLFTQLAQQRERAAVSENQLEMIVWLLFLQAGSSGLSQTSLINGSLRALSKSTGFSEGKLLNGFYDLSLDHPKRLQLGDLAHKLIERAIQAHLFVRLESKRTKRTAVPSFYPELFETIDYFFTKGQLPPEKTIADIRSAFAELQRRSPLRLRLWLQEAIRTPNIRDQINWFFSPETTIELMNLLAPQAGNYARGILVFIKAEGAEWKDWYTGKTEKNFWKLAWKGLHEAIWKGFQPRIYILTILEQIRIDQNLETVLFFKQLGSISLQQTIWPMPLIDRVIQSAIHLSPSTPRQLKPSVAVPQSQTEFAQMNAEQLITWLEHRLRGQVFETDLEGTRPPSLIQFSRHIIQLSHKEKEQVWLLFEDQLVVDLFEQLLSPTELNQFLDLAELVAQVDQQKKKIKPRFFPMELSTLLLEAVLNNRGSISNQKTFITKLLKDWAKAHNLSYQELVETLWPIMSELGPVFRQHSSLNLFSEVLQESLEPAQIEAHFSEKKLSKPKAKKEVEDKKYRKLWDMDEVILKMDEVWLVHNAGLVILWPYLNVLFERADLMENSAFKNEAAQQKAILLSEYLVSGDTTSVESKLVLNKVICGYPVAAPLDVEIEIEDSLKELCEGLIAAAIGHWETIGDTSVEAFRETFLVREGKLGLTKDFWHLEVDKKAYDILMRQLPWGLTPVNLSWMDKIIKVDWE